MNDFYQLPVAELEQRYAALVRQALPLWNIASDSPLSPIKLRENSVFRVFDRVANEDLVVRVHRAGYHGDAELRSEWQWIAALREFGVLTPSLRYSGNGHMFEIVHAPEVPEPRQVDIVDWIEGEQLGSMEEGLQGSAEEIRARFETVGQVMAKMHNQAERWQTPQEFTRHAWDIDGLIGEQPFWGRFWELPALSAGQRDTMQAVRERLRADLTALGQMPGQYGLIHADLLLENILVNGRDIRVIDFDDCGYGWYLFDFATSIIFLHGSEHFDMATQALRIGYRQHRPLTDAQMAWLPVLLMARATTYLGWMHTRAETDTAREMTPYIIELVLNLAQDYLAR